MSMTLIEGNQWVYHPKTGGKLIWLESLQWHLENGYYMTPDDYPVKKTEVVKPTGKKRGRKKKVA